MLAGTSIDRMMVASRTTATAGPVDLVTKQDEHGGHRDGHHRDRSNSIGDRIDSSCDRERELHQLGSCHDIALDVVTPPFTRQGALMGHNAG